MKAGRIPEPVRGAALDESLQRCVAPACRTRVGVKVVRLARGAADRARVAPLCRHCLARFRRGELSVQQVQRWKLRGVDYWENVGAE